MSRGRNGQSRGTFGESGSSKVSTGALIDRGDRMRAKRLTGVVSAALLSVGGIGGSGAGAQAQSPPSIVYALDRDGSYSEIHLMTENGDPVARLTHYRGEDISPDWSPDGERIAFIRDSDPRPPEVYGGDIVEDFNENYDLYVMERDGSNVTRLTRGPAEDSAPEWSPDGTRIAYTSRSDDDGDYDVVIMDLDTGDRTSLTDDDADDYSPSWSPDGTTLAFYSTYRSCTEPCDQSQADVYTVPVEGGSPTLLTGPEFDDVDPVWAPDGQRIFFSRAACCQFDIWSMDPDGTDRMRHTRTRRIDEGSVTFSTEDDRFVFGRSGRGSWSIWMMDLSSAEVTRLTPRGRQAGTPDWL